MNNVNLNLRGRWPALIILIAYLFMGTLYAIYTPMWQVPDEPAHYNYIRALAEGHGFPVMESGDYDQAYLSRLTSERFPATLPIDPLQYEDHQPPLYYLLATPVFMLMDAVCPPTADIPIPCVVLPLRLFSVLLGAVAVGMSMAIGYEVFLRMRGRRGVGRETSPNKGIVLIWVMGGLVAFVPQHVAILAGINNDALAEALFFTWLWLALRYLRGKVSPWTLGGVLGMLLLTKTTVYGAVPLALLVIVMRLRHRNAAYGSEPRAPNQQWLIRHLAAVFLPALLLGGLWWVRNLTVYGWPDVMGLTRHNAVVVDQPRTAAWIARDGLLPFLAGAVRTTFRSFWGQFGWMGVVLDARIYQGLLIFSLLTLWGALWWLASVRFDVGQGLLTDASSNTVGRGLPTDAPSNTVGRGLPTDASSNTVGRGLPTDAPRDALILLASSALITLTLYIVYNLTFVQHQGRYLFTALPFPAILAALGLYHLAERRLALLTGGLLLLAAALLGGAGMIRGDIPLWPMALTLAAAGAVVTTGLLPPRLKGLATVGPLVGLYLLDLVCMFGFIIPQLGDPLWSMFGIF